MSVNTATHEVTAIELTEANVHDCTVLPALLSTQKNVGKVYAYELAPAFPNYC